jgi:hypothetical protein
MSGQRPRARRRTLLTQGFSGALSRTQAHAGRMMTLAHAYAAAEARSCLATLPAPLRPYEASIVYDRALLHLDGLVGDLEVDPPHLGRS